MARPRSELSKFILSLPKTLSAKDVLARVKAKGMKTTESNVYRLRRSTGRAPKQAASSPRPAAARASFAAFAPRASSEDLLRAVAAELGLARSLEILQGERSKVTALLRR